MDAVLTGQNNITSTTLEQNTATLEQNTISEEKSNTTNKNSGDSNKKHINFEVFIVVSIFITILASFIGMLPYSIASHVANGYSTIFYCGNCESAYSINLKENYCESCGVKHSENDYVGVKSHCIQCGKEMSGSNYCKSCGGKVTGESKVRVSSIDDEFLKACIMRPRQ